MNSTIYKESFRLESGTIVHDVQLAFTTYGTLNTEKSNVIWVCHALTANSEVMDWWGGLFGEGRLFDPEEYFIVCVNSIGSCYGSTGPDTPRKNQRPLLEKFPLITTRDGARFLDLVRQELGIESIRLLIGPSLGGQQALEWAILQPEVFENLFLIATNARHSAYGIAFNESQRLAIYTDPTYGDYNINGGKKGLIAARSIALLSYRSYAIYNSTQTETSDTLVQGYKAAGYQRYQGGKLAKRFSAYSYVTLTKMMDSHNVGRDRESVKEALRKIKARTLVIGVQSDQLFPPNEQRFLATHILRSDYAEIDSVYGHDGFLVETEQLSQLMEDFLFNGFKNNRPTVFRTTTRKSELMHLLR